MENFYIEPPVVHIGTDEDSADEDDGGYVYNLTGKSKILSFLLYF